MEPDEPVTVYTVSNAIEAEAIRNLLHAEGIVCEIGGEAQGGFAGVWEIDILTREVDAERARRIIDQHHHHKK